MQGSSDHGDRTPGTHSAELGFHFSEESHEHIHTGQDELDERLIDRATAAANCLQHRLQVMSEAMDGIQSQETSPPLESMERSEQHLDRSGVAGVSLQRQHRRFHIFEQRPGLHTELGQKFGVVDETEDDRDIQRLGQILCSDLLGITGHGVQFNRKGICGVGVGHTEQRVIGNLAAGLKHKATENNSTTLDGRFL